MVMMTHLSENGQPCPVTVAAPDGAVLRTLCARPATIVTFLDGSWPRHPTPTHCAQAGSALARLHMAGKSFPMTRPNDLGRASWRRLFENCRDRADEVTEGLEAEIFSALRVLDENWPDGLPSGLIHADLFPDNVFFMGDKLTGLIDFYFACTDALAYDLAICLNAWCFERGAEFNITKARRLLSAYRDVRPVNDAELAALPLLARGAALRFLLTRLYDWLNQVDGAMVKPKDPLEYLHKMRFHRRITGPGAYGLD